MNEELVLKNNLKEIRKSQKLSQDELALVICIALDKKFDKVYRDSYKLGRMVKL